MEELAERSRREKSAAIIAASALLLEMGLVIEKREFYGEPYRAPYHTELSQCEEPSSLSYENAASTATVTVLPTSALFGLEFSELEGPQFRVVK
jgi:hypothetical protein